MKRLCLACLLALGASMPVHAEEQIITGDEGGPAQATPEGGSPSVADSLPALATFAQVKKNLADKGVTLQINYIGEVLGNVSGGLQRGAIYDGRVETVVEADLGKVVGWQGATFHFNGYWITGKGLTAAYVGALSPVSYIEALSTVRLYELYIDQALFDGALSIRAGQLAADSEFVLAKYAQLFVNGATGWPMLLAQDLPSGGPAYPFATPGVRVKWNVNKNLTLLTAIFDGNPAGPGPGDPQHLDPYGVNFRVVDRPLVMAEAQYSYNGEKDAQGLPGTLKVGAWRHFGAFPDQYYGADATIPASEVPQHNGNYGAYAMIDQQVYKKGDSSNAGVGIFVRGFAAPSNVNPISLYFDGGFNATGLIASRPNDTFGVSAYWGQASTAVVNATVFNEPDVRPTFESGLEATYQAQLVPGWTLQPTVQYVMHPGAGLTGENIPNALVVGLRTTINY